MLNPALIRTVRQWEQVFFSAVVAVVARPCVAQIRKWSPKPRTSSHIRFNFVTSEKSDCDVTSNKLRSIPKGR